ncbi:hypothetical protein ABMA27_004443 [Loxostege sticticalis]|uniref:Uncharacterized protein n=1 Tax=Loxostege sticticalis TaxID=481309 RepID=A0ABR3HNP3_LOXSC
MFSFKAIVLIAAAFAMSAESSAVPAVAAAPLVAPAAVGYAHSIPQNVPPFASQVSVVNRAISPLVAAPAFAPYAAASYLAGPAPLVAGPAPALPAPYALPAAYAAYGAPAPYAAPFPYSAPFLRSPYLAAPAFVR